MGVKLVSASGGSVEINPPATASSFTATMPAGTGNVVVAGINSAIVSGTSQASTSGTSIDFTGIPSWVKRITVMFNGVSTNGSSNMRVRIGPSGGVETTGYAGSSGQTTGSSANTINFTAGFDINGGASSSVTLEGALSLALLDSSTNTWVVQGVIGHSNQTTCVLIGGKKALAGVLSVVRITTVNGTDTFDAGSINILYE
jgi:hypothetical protein